MMYGVVGGNVVEGAGNLKIVTRGCTTVGGRDLFEFIN